MRKLISPFAQLAATLLIVLFFSGCLKDKITRTYTLLTPIYQAKADAIVNIKMNPPEPLKTTGKIYIYGKYIFLNEVNKGVHVIDNSNPSSPVQLGFINIPGNLDIAVKGHTLLADFYSDLVSIDITDPLHVRMTNLAMGVFPEREYENGFTPQAGQVIVGWIRKDTTVNYVPDNQGNGCLNCGIFLAADAQGSSAASVPGVSGSMASFALINDYLYAVDHHSIKVISISNPDKPALKSVIYAGWDIETIYPLGDKLFLGSMGGVFIYNIADPASPVEESNFIHARACDPVIADSHYAFITLRAGTTCGPANNELQIVDISNLQSPALLKTYSMTSPHGLAKDQDLLFICDGTDGLKVYNAADPGDLQLVKKIDGIETYDIIVFNKIALVVATDGLYQYDFSDPGNIHLLSRIAVTN
jgi:hypothetical protein